MYKRLVTLLVLVIVSASLVGCKKDAEINSVMADIHSVTDEIVKKVDASPTVAGVDEAQKLFDAKHMDLKAKWDGIKTARGFQVSEETQKKMSESYINDRTAMMQLQMRHISVAMQDSAFKTKLDKLVKDWEDTFDLPK